MNPFLRKIGRYGLIFNALAMLAIACMAATHTLGSPWPRMAYTMTLCASALAVLIGGGLAIRQQNAERTKVPDSIARPDRLDAAAVVYLLGFALGLGVGKAVSQGGESLAVVGALLGAWLFSQSPLSPVFILAVLAWTTVYGLWAGAFHYDLDAAPVLRMVPASLAMLAVAGLLRRFLALRGPAGMLHTLCVFGWCLLVPLGVGIFGPTHALPSAQRQHQTPLDLFIIYNLVVCVLLAYHWSLRATAGPGEPMSEATHSGCVGTYLGFGIIAIALDRVGSQVHACSRPVQILAFLLAGLATVWLSEAAVRRIRRVATN